MKYTLILAASAAALLTNSALSQTTAENAPTATAEMINAQGEAIGTATFTETPNGVLIRAELQGLEPGEHGYHIHQTGQCDAQGGFETAGGHFNPGEAEHGFMMEGGPHAGDMPNQFVAEDGKLNLNVINTAITLGESDGQERHSVFDDDGSALVIHAGQDDYESQPSGDAGDRIACGVIEKAGG